MKTQIESWGDSLAIKKPPNFADKIGIQNKSFVDIFLLDGKLVIVPIEKVNFTLDQLLASVTKENIHHEWNSGPIIENEVL